MIIKVHNYNGDGNPSAKDTHRPSSAELYTIITAREDAPVMHHWFDFEFEFKKLLT